MRASKKFGVIDMAKCYFELRKQSARGTDSVAADIMRHLHTRQHIGKVVIVCSQPLPLLAASRKQWLKLSRSLQKQRASTLNADKILKYTHTITHMQHMRFTIKSPLENPDADVYFLKEDYCDVMPLHCFSIYFPTPIKDKQRILHMLEQLPADTLMIDYNHHTPWASLGLQPKAVLETQVISEWAHVQQFLKENNIHIASLVQDGIHDIEAMDDALDTLLGKSHNFLRLANEFQRALELARPIRITRAKREEYDSLALLAYRVQALSPGVFSQRFLESFNEDDSFFLYDIGKKRFAYTGEPLATAVQRHLAAGRKHLAHSLRQALVTQ